MAIGHTSYVGVAENVDAGFPCAAATPTSFEVYSNVFGPLGVAVSAVVSSGTAPPGLSPFICQIATMSRGWMVGTPTTPGVYVYTVHVTTADPSNVFIDVNPHIVYGVGSIDTPSGGTTVGGPGGSYRGGTTIRITGKGFTGPATVLFRGGGASPPVAGVGVVVVGDTEILVVTPPHAVGPVSIEVVGVGTVADAFTFVGVTRVSPKAGTVAGGTPVTITGFGFAGATSVLFGGVAVTPVVVSNTTITLVTPPHPSGCVEVEVVGVDTSNPCVYTYTLPVPQILGKGPALPPIPTRRTA